MSSRLWRGLALATSLAAAPQLHATESFYGTLEPFVSEAVYFAITDRFVDGDPANNFPGQGGEHPSFDRPLKHANGEEGNIGYLGGDFRGLLDNAGYIREMGFTALWITPIVENPDEAFSGGFPYGSDAFFTDFGKTGYHGYWGVNFYQVDEHWESKDLRFADFTRALREEYGMKLVLDIVANHGSPAYTMPRQQSGYGQVFDAGGNLVADHRNMAPADLDPNDPLQQFFRREPDLAQLSNFDDRNPAVIDYLVGAYLQWIDQGAAAFRIDTIRHVPHAFWKVFSDRIRAQHPGFFMFGEAFDWEAANIAPHTYQENGGVSVLDFPGKKAMESVFVDGADFAGLTAYLHLDDGVYRNPYELAIFYDNHDMPRVKADSGQLIDLHNWLFTSRGFPVVYYGSEAGFMSGASEHRGNRNYFGQERIDAAREHPVRRGLAAVGAMRQRSVALQRGLQVNLRFQGDQAAFLRVYQHDGEAETALVLLNKDDAPADMVVESLLDGGRWRDLQSGATFEVGQSLEATVPGHGVRVFVRSGEVRNHRLREALRAQMAALALPVPRED